MKTTTSVCLLQTDNGNGKHPFAFAANGNGKRKSVFPGWQTRNGNRRLLFKQTSITIYRLPTKENKLLFSIFAINVYEYVYILKRQHIYRYMSRDIYINRYKYIYLFISISINQYIYIYVYIYASICILSFKTENGSSGDFSYPFTVCSPFR